MLLFLGDSITEGIGASGKEHCYVHLVGEKLKKETWNYGVSGTRIARQKHPTQPLTFDWDFQHRAECMPEGAEFVIVFGGTNDFGHGDAEMGDFYSHDAYTFCGGFRNLIELLIQRYGKEKLCFLLPLRRYEEVIGVKTLLSYVLTMKRILSEYGVDYLDFYSDCLPRPLTEQSEEYFLDGVHPNDRGHQVITEKICKYLESKL